MGKNTEISWAHHTFNPWWGCEKVSDACAHCYAETWAKRCGKAVWGKEAPRRFFGEKHWAEPLRWNAEAEKVGERKRVFCASMADVFEDRDDTLPHFVRLMELIRQTPWLDWLLLTKRPEKFWERMEGAMFAARDGNQSAVLRWLGDWVIFRQPPPNVWMGATVEDMKTVRRVKELRQIPAVLRFLSCEPLLERLSMDLSGIGWVICGGESGRQARPMQLEWARYLRFLCSVNKVPFHFKQWGEWAPDVDGRMLRVGKVKAGRELDWELHDAVPKL